jgi:TonB family protein
MKKHRKPESFIPAPSYPGGNEAMKKFVTQNLRYPKEAFENNIEGTVRVKFDVDMKGNVSKAEVLDGLGHGCDEEAKRLVMLLKFEPTRVRGVRVVHHKTINIYFRLPPKPAITYSFKSAEKPSAENKPGDSTENKGGYTINIPGHGSIN